MSTLNGSSGNDTLYSLPGADVMTGNAGADRFVLDLNYSQFVAPDQITDFSHAEGDRIQLTGMLRPAVFRGEIAGFDYADGVALPGADLGTGFTQVWWARVGSGADTETLLIIDGNNNFELDSSDCVVEFTGSSFGSQSADLTEADFTAGTFPHGNDTLIGGEGDDTIEGLGGNDSLQGLLGSDSIDGGPGNDTLVGDEGADTLIGGAGNDVLYGGDGNDTLYGGAGDDTLVGGTGNGRVDGGAGNDYLDSSVWGGDTLIGGAGDDTLFGGAALADGGDGNDSISGYFPQVFGGAGDDTINFNFDRDQPTPTVIDGGDGYDVLIVATTDSPTFGLDGLRHVEEIRADGQIVTTDAVVEAGATLKVVAVTSLYFDGSAETDGHFIITGGNLYSNHLYGGALADTISGGGGPDVIRGGGGDDSIDGGAGIDTAIFSGNRAAYLIEALPGAVQVSGPDGVDLLQNVNILQFDDQSMEIEYPGVSLTGTSARDTLAGGEGNDTLRGAAGDDTLQGLPGADSLLGGIGNDSLSGDVGADTLNGGAGNDVLDGGEGPDTLLGGDGNDQLSGGVAFGAADANLLDGGAGDDSLGGSVWDTLLGGDGNDSLWGEASLADGGDGNDLIFGSSLQVFGGGGDDTIVGTSADLETLVDGGDGYDVYTPWSGGDLGMLRNVEELRGGGASVVSDAVVAAGAMLKVVGNGGEVSFDGSAETDGHFLLVGSEFADKLFGGGQADTISAGAGDDVLQGGGGNDSIDGGAGFDTAIFGGDRAAYVVETLADSVQVTGPDGVDLLQNVNLLQFDDQSVELTYPGTGETGSAGNDSLNGGEGDDTLDGSAGNDTLQGDIGADSLSGSGGDDSLLGGHGEDTLLGGDGGDRMAGGSDADYLDGGAGDDFLSADEFGGGFVFGVVSDTLLGGPGSDTLEGYPGSPAASALADGGEGNDLIRGNFIQIFGGAGDDTIASAFESATLIDGGDGYDIFIWSDEQFGAAAGIGLLRHIEEFRVASSSNVPLVSTDAVVEAGATLKVIGVNTFNGAAESDGHFAITGSDGADRLTGGAQADTISGGAGNDTIDGGPGDDSLEGDAGNDSLAGGAGNDGIAGGEGDDTLMGGAGNDSIDGGLGSDTAVFTGNRADYRIDTLAGALQVTHLNGGAEGVDLLLNVNVLQFADQSVPIVVPGLHLIGTDGDDSLVGAEGNDTIQALGGDDTLDGAAGRDSMEGDAGDDLYYVNSAGDLVVEQLGEGIDTVRSTISYTLASEVEDLDLSGAKAINGTGNELANAIQGNNADNRINGGSADDTLYGVGGNDTVIGGDGDDLIEGGSGAGDDRYVGGLGHDTVKYSSAVHAVTADLKAQVGSGVDVGHDTLLQIENLIGGRGSDSFSGSDDANVLYGAAGNDTLIGIGGNDVLEGGTGLDSMLGGRGNDIYLVDQPGDAVVENAGEGLDQVQSTISYSLGMNVENLLLYGAGKINGTGNQQGNVLTGNAAKNVLTGMNGADTLNGGLGIDTLNGGAGSDQYWFTTATGAQNADVIQGFASGTDKIVLGDVLYAGLGTIGAFTPNDPRFYSAPGAAGGSDLTAQVVYDTQSGQLYYDFDGSGPGAAMLIATLSGHPGLAATDILVN